LVGKSLFNEVLINNWRHKVYLSTRGVQPEIIEQFAVLEAELADAEPPSAGCYQYVVLSELSLMGTVYPTPDLGVAKAIRTLAERFPSIARM